MTTKKSKPASLTSSLLARKGEAEPAAAPYSIPETGRQRPAESMAGKGNGNGGDLGRSLSGMSRATAATPEPKSAAPEDSVHPAAIRPVETPVARVVPPAPPPVAPLRAAGPEPVADEDLDEEPEADHLRIAESSAAKPVAEAASASAERTADERPVAANNGSPKGDGGGGAGSDGGEAEQEAARDARLLRFVYIMAALTGIVAIVLYAGGWLREGPKQRAAEETVASAPASNASPKETQTSTAPEAGGSSAPQAPGETQAIPPAPPVVPPSTAETKPGAPEAPVTTGGPAKPQPDALPPMPSNAAPDAAAATPALPPAAAVPTIPAPSGTQSGPAEAKGPANAQPGAPGGHVGTAPAKSADAGPTSPKAAGAGEPAAKQQVRDVPNLRVLAPALVKPEPAESAPPPKAAVPEPGNIPVLTVPKAQTAAVPKSAPVKPPKAAVGGGDFLIQLASVTSEKLAEREWARLQKVFPDVLGGRKLTIEKKEIAGRGTFYRVQTGGYATVDEARAICNGLKQKKQACLPVNR